MLLIFRGSAHANQADGTRTTVFSSKTSVTHSRHYFTFKLHNPEADACYKVTYLFITLKLTLVTSYIRLGLSLISTYIILRLTRKIMTLRLTLVTGYITLSLTLVTK